MGGTAASTAASQNHLGTNQRLRTGIVNGAAGAANLAIGLGTGNLGFATSALAQLGYGVPGLYGQTTNNQDYTALQAQQIKTFGQIQLAQILAQSLPEIIDKAGDWFGSLFKGGGGSCGSRNVADNNSNDSPCKNGQCPRQVVQNDAPTTTNTSSGSDSGSSNSDEPTTTTS